MPVDVFYKMAVLITLTISFSLLYSTLFFIPLCAQLGPNGTFGDIVKYRHGKGSEVSPQSALKHAKNSGDEDTSKDYKLPELEEDEAKNYKLPETSKAMV